ncbi:MAG: glycoside hydrolase family 140 protein [Clostridia bacterium]|nr:glycoside hydrolase family 140 protein [Clostridia bacterium]
MQKLQIHENGRFIQHEDGTPFFYLGDTAWDLVHRLTKDEKRLYMSVRASQGFNVIQCIAFSDFPNKHGRYALVEPKDALVYDDEGEYSYWAGVDEAVELAEEYGMYVGLLPLWNSSYDNPEHTLFRGYGPSYEYGKWLAERYKDKTNIIWILGGDVKVKPHMHEIFDGLAAGIKAGERDDNHHLMTFHPCGPSDTVSELGGDRDYLDFLGSQSGHTVDYSYDPVNLFEKLIPTGKPYVDLEPHYEDHVANWVADFRRWDGSDIREGAYESVFAGACGQGYGNPIVAFFLYEPLTQYGCTFYYGHLEKYGYDTKGWHHALRHEGAESLKHLKKLRLSRPYFDFRPAPELVLNSDDDFLFGKISAARGDDYAFIYSPYGREIEVDCSQINTQFIRASWFNPRNGEERLICYLKPRKAVFQPETWGKGQDWVLVLDGGKRDWKEIGQITLDNRDEK